MVANFNPDRALTLVQQASDVEARVVLGLKTQVSADFTCAVKMVFGCIGRVVVLDMGKPGHVARKTAVTLISAGTSAFFVHSVEVSHSDLGMATHDDVFIGFLNSGEMSELNVTLSLVERMGVRLTAVAGNPGSSFGRHVDVVFNSHIDVEAYPLNLTPTTSTIVQTTLGDALVVTVLDTRGFGAEDFTRLHPGRSLDHKLLTHMRDAIRVGDVIPRADQDTPLSQALMEIIRRDIVMTAVVDARDHAVDAFIDGNLRRLLETPRDWHTMPINKAMHRSPRSIGSNQLAVKAVEVMETHRVNRLLAADAADLLADALHIHDLTRTKII